ncbi:MAG: efflux RND transporter periplasmic adaptor subunit [Planctomycetota bacterium]
MTVAVTKVRQTTFLETVRGVGTLRAKETVEIRPETSGTISQIHVEDGQTVAAGDRLFSIDDSKLQAERAAAEAALEEAKARRRDARNSFERNKKLLKREVIAKDDFDAAKAKYEAVQAEVDRLEANAALIGERIEDTRIRAPVDGVLSELAVDVGDYVARGSLLVTLYTLDPLELAVTVPETHMGRVREGQPVDAMVDAYADERFEGTVRFVAPNVDERTREFLVKAVVDNPDLRLKPGAFATAAVTVAEREGRPAMPEKALVATREGYLVYVVEEATARERSVTVGQRRAGLAEVSEGLEGGETVVTAGQWRLSDGQAVTVQGSDGEGAAPGTDTSARQ